MAIKKVMQGLKFSWSCSRTRLRVMTSWTQYQKYEIIPVLGKVNDSKGKMHISCIK